MIHAVIFSYQNKNLKKVVDQLFKNTTTDLFLMIFDKHTIDRSGMFKSLSYSNNIEYTSVFWDELDGPPDYKANSMMGTPCEYFLFLSDDILLSEGWDLIAIDFLKSKKAIISGAGIPSVKKKNLFFFDQERKQNNDFYKTTIVDKNFIFGKTENLKNIYPKELKYYGEDEMLSLNLYNNNIEVFSSPSTLYEDLNCRTFEKEYVVFSLEHNYNLVIDSLMQASDEFLNSQGISRKDLCKLPYNPNDVSYNPYLLNFQEMDARKFIEEVKEIS